MFLLFVVCCRWTHQVHIFLGKLLQWGKMSLMQRHFLKRGIKFDSLASYVLEKLFFFFWGGGSKYIICLNSYNEMNWMRAHVCEYHMYYPFNFHCIGHNFILKYCLPVRLTGIQMIWSLMMPVHTSILTLKEG